MKKKMLLPAVALFMALFVIACGGGNDDPKPEPDTEAPSMVLTKPMADGSTGYSRGAPMAIDILFKDNVALSKCVVSISYPTQASSGSIVKGIGTPWSPAESGAEDIIEFDGETERRITRDLFGASIESNCLGGEYLLKFDLTDKSGNLTSETISVQIN